MSRLPDTLQGGDIHDVKISRLNALTRMVTESRETSFEARQALIRAEHITEWLEYRQHVLLPALVTQDPGTVRSAKILAETIRIMQSGERDAWQMSAKAEIQSDGPITIQWRT